MKKKSISKAQRASIEIARSFGMSDKQFKSALSRILKRINRRDVSEINLANGRLKSVTFKK